MISVRDELKKVIQQALQDLGLETVLFSVEYTIEKGHGDVASNVALVAAKQAKKNPIELAEAIISKINRNMPHVGRIEIGGKGFINFYLNRSFFSESVQQIIENSHTWGKDTSETGEEVLFEYTSPNLFKPLHIGNLVGNIIGESLSRLHEYSGATVRRVNYPSDIGLTVAKGVWGIIQTGGNPEVINDLGRAYVFGNHAYEKGGEEKKEIESVNRSLYEGQDATLNGIRERGIKTSRARIAELCSILGTSFDTEILESQASAVGVKLVHEALSTRVFDKSDGAIVYRGEKAGFHTRVFINSQGLPTYEAKDLGNFKMKKDAYPDWTRMSVVTGNEQTEYFNVIISALREIFPDTLGKNIEHIPTGFLTLTTGKMSSRKGNVLTGESLIEELRLESLARAKETRAPDVEKLADMIAVAALKYQILRQKVGTNITFDKKQALSFEGNSGPYLQYTHARTMSVLEKANSLGITASTQQPPEDEYEIEKLIYRFPEVTQRSLVERSPHYIVTFLTELAAEYNAFYATERIADVDDIYAPYKVAITDAVRITLSNGLYVLGMQAPSEM